jgi:Zn-dependent protease with chaperone function
MKSLFRWTTTLLFIFTIPIQAQTSASTIEDEIRLGLNIRSSILANRAELTEGPEIEVSQEVFRRLLDTSFVRQGDPFPYRLTLFAGNSINASSSAGGQIMAEGGIVRILKDSPGLWAAVLGHEIAHTRSHHQYKAYIRLVELEEKIDYYKRRAAAGDQSANWALLALNLAGGLLNLKLSRDEELEADRLGMFMMAEAGYHPDFAITCYRKIAFKSGDQSKAAAFFADHPRWETREQRALRAYDDALEIFNSRWPDIDSSPGGRPPVIANLNDIVVEKDSNNRMAIIRGTLNIRNAKDTDIAVGAEFYHKDTQVPSFVDKYRTKKGYLWSVVQGRPQSMNETIRIQIHVPTDAIGINQRKLNAYLVAFEPGGEVLDTSKKFNVSFPK